MNTKRLLAVSVMTLMSGVALAHGGIDLTNPYNHATRPELAAAVKTLNAADAKETAARIDGDKANAATLVAETKGRKDADTQLGYEINTQAKYTTSVNEDLQASKAAGVAAYNQIQGQIGTTNGAVKAVDDKVNNAIGAQSGINGQLQSGINDAKGAAVNAQNTAEVAVGLGQKGINDAYNAQKAAEHAEGTAQDAGNKAVNAQNTANYAVGQGQKNANDIINTNATVAGNKAAQDKVNTQQGNTNVKLQNGIDTAQQTANTAFENTLVNDKNINTVNNKLTETIGVVNQHTGQINAVATQTVANKNDIVGLKATTAVHTGQITNLNQVTAAQGKTLVDHDARISGTEQKNVQQDKRLDQNDAKWTTQAGINNEYGQRIGGVEQSVANIDTSYRQFGARMDQYDNRLNKVEKKADRADEASVIALAVAGHQFNTDLEAGFQIALSGATNGNQQGVAFGAGGAITKNLFLNIGVGSAGSTTGGVVSATYAFGR